MDQEIGLEFINLVVSVPRGKDLKSSTSVSRGKDFKSLNWW